jgi:hypothetical protein
VHAKSNAYPTTMLSLMNKKTERITMLNEKRREETKRNGTSKTQAKELERIINKKLMNDAEVESSNNITPHYA